MDNNHNSGNEENKDKIDNTKNEENDNDYITQCVINSVKFIGKFIHKSVKFVVENKNQILTGFIVCAAVGGIAYIGYVEFKSVINRFERIESSINTINTVISVGMQKQIDIINGTNNLKNSLVLIKNLIKHNIFMQATSGNSRYSLNTYSGRPILDWRSNIEL